MNPIESSSVIARNYLGVVEQMHTQQSRSFDILCIYIIHISYICIQMRCTSAYSITQNPLHTTFSTNWVVIYWTQSIESMDPIICGNVCIAKQRFILFVRFIDMQKWMYLHICNLQHMNNHFLASLAADNSYSLKTNILFHWNLDVIVHWIDVKLKSTQAIVSCMPDNDLSVLKWFLKWPIVGNLWFLYAPNRVKNNVDKCIRIKASEKMDSPLWAIRGAISDQAEYPVSIEQHIITLASHPQLSREKKLPYWRSILFQKSIAVATSNISAHMEQCITCVDSVFAVPCNANN